MLNQVKLRARQAENGLRVLHLDHRETEKREQGEREVARGRSWVADGDVQANFANESARIKDVAFLVTVCQFIFDNRR